MLYTIGTSNHSADDFFGTLSKYGVTRVIDVRSSPKSQFHHFRHPEIMLQATSRGFKYAWHGEVMGGLNTIKPTDPVFEAKLDLIFQLAEHQSVAMFCAEGDPSECHRSGKIGAYALLKHGIVTQNILRNGKVEDITRTILRTDFQFLADCLESAALAQDVRALALASEQSVLHTKISTAE